MDRALGFFWSPAEGDNHTEQIARMAALGANTVYVPHARLTRALLDQLRGQPLRVIVEQGLFIGAELRAQFPASVPIDAVGKPFDRDGWYVPACPNHPQVRRHRLEAIADLLDHAGHALDGLWLDFVRFPVRWEGPTPNLGPWCFCRHCLNFFRNEARAEYSQQATAEIASTILHERHDEWVAWKCNSIADFVHAVKAQITARDLTLPLGIFALPWRRADFDGAMRRVASQDLALLARDVDCFSPMVYHKLCHQSPAWISHVVEDHAAWTNKPMLPIIQSVHQPDAMSPAQLDQALTQALDVASGGAMIFTAAPVLASPELAAVVRRHFAGNAASAPA